MEQSKDRELRAAAGEEQGAAPRDPRVAHLCEVVASGRYDLLSLDVFDTVVWRRVPLPHDVHFLVARRLIALGAFYPTASPESYVRERVAAEERARKRSPSFEVTLEQIFAEFPAGYLRGFPAARLAELECEVERQVVRPDEGIAEVIRRARAHGLRIALVSDTYFRSEQVAALAGVAADFVIVSCEHNASKYQGLHRTLISQSGVSPGRILHVGDDHGADVEGPAVFGIDRYWYRKAPESFAEILAAELPTTLSHRSPYFAADDGGLSYLRRRAAGLCADPHERWGAGVLGPIACGFAEWVAWRCGEEGIPRAYCLMREGRLLKALLDGAGTALSTHEIFLSRYVARKAAIFEGTEEELYHFVHRPTPRRRSRILEQLGVEGDHPWATQDDEFLDGEGSTALIRRIAREAKLRRQILRSSERIRAGLLAHLRRAAGALDGGRVAVVDLGYRGTIQECLERIFLHEGIRSRTHGFYLVTSAECGATQATGAPAEGWLAENGQPIAMAHTFVRSPEIFEQSLMAECGTTVDYTEDGTPVLDEVRVPPEQVRQIAAIQRGVRLYGGLWSDPARRGTEDLRRLRSHYQAICVRAVARPREHELDLFESWVHDENFGSGRARRLSEVVDLDPWEAAHLSAHQVASLPHQRVYWPFGFARRQSPVLGEAVAGIYLRAVEPEVFQSSEPPRHLVVYWDTGRGFHAQESQVVTYSLNDRGRVWLRLRLELQGAGASAFGFSIGLPGEVVRLTGVRFVRPGEEGESAAVRVPHEAMEIAGYERLHENLYLVREDPAVLIARLDEAERRPGKLDIDLFFGVVAGG